MNVELPGVQWDELWLPLRPYATNRLQDGIRRERRPVAMTRRYVEANPSAISNLLVVDVDHADAVLRAVSSVGSHPLPNAVVGRRNCETNTGAERTCVSPGST
ncbi:hypothetical protein [Streptomyces griseus]|uniref:hypothetical protein n=1 Tax=Streptomyces griseus TaxID=1911 RepID=UPI0036E5DD2A